MMNLCILFRGRQTGNIVADARAAGLIPADAEIRIICRQGDALAMPGDVTALGSTPEQCKITVIANGGTSAQLVPLIASLASAAATEDAESNEWSMVRPRPARAWRWSAWDVQRDGVSCISGDRDA